MKVALEVVAEGMVAECTAVEAVMAWGVAVRVLAEVARAAVARRGGCGGSSSSSAEEGAE